ncbi:MAG: hypothetical protein GEU95_01545 [Rhizobiales bacterium]|nr:hypothetical protein [Hyphomicrobiales bacterium]
MTFKNTIIPAIMAAALTGATADAAPVAPPAGVAAAPLETVQFRGGNWYDHPLMYGGNWREHQRRWDAIEGRGANARSNSCARFRSYAPRTLT